MRYSQRGWRKSWRSEHNFMSHTNKKVYVYSDCVYTLLKYSRITGTITIVGTITHRKPVRKLRNLFNNFANHYRICALRSPATLKQEGVTVTIIKEGYAQLSPSTTNRLIMQFYSFENVLCKKTVNLPTFMEPFIYRYYTGRWSF